MANIKSQKKRNRQTVVRNARNRAARSELRTRLTAVDAAIEAGDTDQVAELAKAAQKQIDTAVGKGIMKKNTAARRKSALARKVNAAQ